MSLILEPTPITFMYIQALFLPYTVPMLTLTTAAATANIISPTTAIIVSTYTILTTTLVSAIAIVPTICASVCYNIYTNWSKK